MPCDVQVVSPRPFSFYKIYSALFFNRFLTLFFNENIAVTSRKSLINERDKSFDNIRVCFRLRKSSVTVINFNLEPRENNSEPLFTVIGC